MPSNHGEILIRKETEFTKRALDKDYKHPSSNDLMKNIAGAWEELKCTHCGKRLTINQDVEGSNMNYCNEECKRLHNSMAPMATCAYCGKEGSDVNNECNKCHTVKYCNAACKKKHRKKHKKVCERIVSDGLANSNVKSEETSDELQSNFESRSDLLGQIHTSVDTANQNPESECHPDPADNPNKVKLRRSTASSIGRCKDDNCTRIAKLSSGYCLRCDKRYNYYSKEEREREEFFMNMDACYHCEKDDDEPLKKCDYCRRFYHAGHCSGMSPNSFMTNEEFKCRICKLDENWQQQKEEKENESSSPPSLSNVSNANTVSNEQIPAKSVEECIKSRGDNPKWSNRLLMKAMGIEEETPSDTTISKERREEEDTSPSPSSSSNVNTESDKDKMIRLFESITINDDVPNGAVKKVMLKMMSISHDHNLVLSDEDQKSEEHAFKQIKEQINDVDLFKLLPPRDDCPICLSQLPYLSSSKVYMSCCGKVVCNLCDRELRKENPTFCLLCKTPMPNSNEEIVKRYVERSMLDDDQLATNSLGCFYQSGTFGLPQNYAMSFRLYHWARTMGSAEAYCNIADFYDRGLGVKRDYEKAWHYYELAAMGGNLVARYNLGTSEMLVGNTERALKHFVIAVRSDCVDSLNKVKIMYREGYATKEDYINALRYYQAYDDRKSQTAPRKVEEKSETDQAIIEAAALHQINEERRPTKEEEEIIQLLIDQRGGSREEMVKYLTDKGAFKPLKPVPQPAPQHVQEELPDGVKQDDIRLVMSEAGVSRNRAIKALVENDDLVDAIFSLTT